MSLFHRRTGNDKTVTIELLQSHAHHVPTLARWHFDEWNHLYEDWSVDAVQADLQAHVTEGIPTTLVALCDGDVIGSVSLVDNDLRGYEHLNPWLASLYVRSDWRGKGVGGKLVDAALAQARKLGITRLYLFTPGQRAFYLGKGFVDLQQAESNGQPVTIMVNELASG